MNAGPLGPEPEPGAAPWRRLSARVIWVDLARSLLAVLPGAIAIVFFGLDPSWGTMWPLLLVAVLGVGGAVADVVRWVFTRYRVTDTEIERSTGLLVRRRRTIQRDRIRSVDSHARLLHRLAGLRVVAIGAGQQVAAGESALLLDALTAGDAAILRRELLDSGGPAGRGDGRAGGDGAGDGRELTGREVSEPVDEILATIRPSWVVLNMVSIWGYLAAIGLLWGLFWLLSTFGVDLGALAARMVDWGSLGWVGITVVGLVAGGVVGAIVLGVSFVASHWRFELARARLGERSYLRTRRGLFSTREVNRDEARLRGLTLAEPLIWRWLGVASAHVITTGLSVWDTEEPTAILPRVRLREARVVGARVLGEPSPFDAALRAHPRAALRRRLWWATLAGLVAVGGVAVPVATGTAPAWVLGVALAVWPVALVSAAVAYRSLGHAIAGDYLVVRSGVLTRSTSALRRDAVSTVAVRQSVLQRRLGLATVSAMTAGGWGAYEAPDVAAPGAVALAAGAAPGVVDLIIDQSIDQGSKGER